MNKILKENLHVVLPQGHAAGKKPKDRDGVKIQALLATAAQSFNDVSSSLCLPSNDSESALQRLPSNNSESALQRLPSSNLLQQLPSNDSESASPLCLVAAMEHFNANECLIYTLH